METHIAIFRQKEIRKTVHNNEWWFSIIDIIETLTGTERPRKYWSDLKKKLASEGYSEVSENIGQLKLVAPDGKKRETDCANTETLFRIIQSIPSPKVEPLKRWLARVGYERIQEIDDPELATKRTRAIYKAKGYSNSWIEKRMRGIEIRETLRILEWSKSLLESRKTMDKKDEMYYDAMDLLNEDGAEEAIEILQEILKMDMDFVPAYVGLAAAFRELGNLKKEKECANLGFEITKKIFPVWPKRMEWGIMDNRAYMRSICDKATTSQISGDRKTSEELYRLLLKMNPNDNQGIRYLIAGMFAGLPPKDIDDMFDEGNTKQDWSKLRKMVIEQNKRHNFWKEPKY